MISLINLLTLVSNKNKDQNKKVNKMLNKKKMWRILLKENNNLLFMNVEDKRRYVLTKYLLNDKFID